MNISHTKPKKPIKGILFDLDGTLVDTSPDMIHALNLVLSKHGLPSVDISAARSSVSYGAIALLQLGFGEAWEKFNAMKLRQEYLDTYADNIYKDTSIFPGFEELNDLLLQKNIAWGIVTNKPAYLTESLLEKMTGLENRQCLIAADTMPTRKPHSSGVLLGAGHLKVAPQNCAYIGDCIRDIEAANYADMYSVAAAYGFIRDDDSHTYWGADAHIDSLHELKDLLLS